ncbi:MAG: efflux RND transporter periplasmic adaptor subunit [Methylovulum sp.]|uniref:efflux RND transporter periplasmic adaptor subunit n=1 Tax=Methylovulum sp. TaxID=1916980 RepID=UPI0026314B32|nr:efflux RND transporter periplasmic adaptor subunit [Methylovulum sp.]MDD2724603.1 efflux RND transporter periplasmic adaptor subunit [Methylovulum sp.]MDD5123370.1 efflux RND transporter periplasmic adaptor subunit [Methylovulum sp.]
MRHLRFGLLALPLLVACDKPVEAPPPPRPALVMKVTDTATDTAMTLVGRVQPRYESAQGFRIAGKIVERRVEMGSKVSKGQVLARLDATDSQLNVAAATAEVAAAQASHALAVAEINRQRQLFAKKFISASALDIHEAELKASGARLAKVKAQANISGNQSQYTTLTADRDGVVSFIQAEPGQVVEAGDVIVKIADTRTVDVVVAVPESRMAEVKLQASVYLKLWADQQKLYTGVIREIAPEADTATRTFNVRITLEQADTSVKFGMTAGVKFPVPSTTNPGGVIVPSRAVTANNGKSQVWVIADDNHAHVRDVQTGAFREDGVVICSGLNTGETIAIAGVHTLTENQLIRPIMEAQP